ncbi:limonene hydroxylase [Clostridium ragsdalei P11]|uniref:Limonene hydroxylase n=1 Tax=Clostridium ragsdalei P11 TaxID=1353534 RepID=A0A1A6B3R5_9CLOT|nr:sigma-54-dependent Fis family transcriptional regulator [Clostridium ragsdalei]OBR96925.1 limonene hydroxylase [Clostridium ragsdalei P11]
MENYIKFIAKAWKDFIEEGYLNSAVRPEIADSWKRCKNYEVDPLNGRGNSILTGRSIAYRLEQNEDLISIAKPVVKSLCDIVAGSGFVIMLVDKEGYVIEALGDTDIMKSADELKFVVGSLWTEREVGTNAIGTALYLDKPIQTIGAEHYGVKQHSWTCSAAPIHNEDGDVVGCINMSGNYYDAHLHTLGIVTVAAQAIETQFDLTISNKLMNTTFDSVTEGMIVLDSKLNIKKINDKALNILDMKSEKTIKLNITSIIHNVDFKNILNGRADNCNDIECDFYVEGSRIKCLISVLAMKVKNKIMGIVITFRECKYYHKLVKKVMGYTASYNFDNIVTVNSKMKEIIKFAKKVARSECNILIEGESGTGKELLAQSIHNYSERCEGPFVAINCSSIPRELVESELFGYEKGAFTGALKQGKPGKFELADGGTIFLDEVGELPLDIQSKLLRVLDNNKITRVGGTYEKQLNVRVIGATNRVLKDEIKKKNFRSDLYYRLSVMNIKTVPLRERKEDIELLIKYFMEELNSKSLCKKKVVEKAYIEKIKTYDWPGNVRELRNVIERDYYLSEDKMVPLDYLEKEIYEKNVSSDPVNISVLPMDVLEKENIENALEKCNGNILKAAKSLNISRSTMYRKMKKYGIKSVSK